MFGKALDEISSDLQYFSTKKVISISFSDTQVGGFSDFQFWRHDRPY